MGKAATTGAGEHEAKAWIEQQKAALKSGPAPKVMEALEPYLEASDVEDKNARVLAAAI